MSMSIWESEQMRDLEKKNAKLLLEVRVLSGLLVLIALFEIFK